MVSNISYQLSVISTSGLFITDYPNMILLSKCAILQVKGKIGNSVSFNPW